MIAILFVYLGLVMVGFILGFGLAAFLRGADDDIPQEPGIRLEDGQGNVHVLHPKAKRVRLVRPQAW
jgi:hypothetical protein